MTLFGCFLISRLSWVALAPFGGRYIDTVFVVERNYAVESGQAYSGPQAGIVCNVNTLRPCWGFIAMR